MERQSKESRGLEAHCRGSQGPPRAVGPSGGELNVIVNVRLLVCHVSVTHVSSLVLRDIFSICIEYTKLPVMFYVFLAQNVF